MYMYLIFEILSFGHYIVLYNGFLISLIHVIHLMHTDAHVHMSRILRISRVLPIFRDVAFVRFRVAQTRQAATCTRSLSVVHKMFKRTRYNIDDCSGVAMLFK